MLNPFKSNYTFGEDEKLLEFRFKMLKIMLVLLIIFSLYFAILYSNGIREVVFFEEYSRYFHALIAFLLLIQLNISKKSFTFVSYAIVFISVILFSMIMVTVPVDGFRMVWFHLLMVGAFVSFGITLGVASFVLSFFALLITYVWFDAQISHETMLTVILSLMLLGVMLFFYTLQINKFEHDLIESSKRFKRLAAHDSLTEILNRRVFLEMSQKYLSKARRNKESLFFMMLDIDHFKKINDTHGHAVGDQVLKLYTQIISKILRKNDLFGRLGGEEFGIVIVERSDESAGIVAEKVRSAIEKYDFIIDGQRLQLTVSIGLAQCIVDLTLEEIMHLADGAMYEAKQSGRNKVVTHKESV